MSGYKHIERLIGRYIAATYASAVEVGSGCNLTAAEVIFLANIPILCTDIRLLPCTSPVRYVVDSIWNPDLSLYRNAECIYAIRPTEEMMASLIAVAQRVNSDLLVYHLGFERFGNGNEEIIDCGVPLIRYVRHRNERE
ncbi:MAG: hypothetical protein JXA44_12305 [Methanospirillaceae archaeon]|nr:hypothetical protein [Methanospirillaceae archaeon]